MKPTILAVLAIALGASGLMAQLKPKSKGEADAMIALMAAARSGDNDATIKAADDLLSKYADTAYKATALNMESSAYHGKGDDDHAQVYAEQAVNADPEDYQAPLLIGGTLVQHSGENDFNNEEKLAKAEKYLNLAIENAKAAAKPVPQMPDSQWEEFRTSLIAKAHADLGRLSTLRKRLDAATPGSGSAEAVEKYDPAERARALAFSDNLNRALRAAEEPKSFASIRGDFDLSGSDSHHWKTSFKLPDAEKCDLMRTPPPASTSVFAWTLACTFRPAANAAAAANTFERMVKSVQSVLNLTYQPGEQAAFISQVFFADPSRPAWKLFVAKISDATIGVAIVVAPSAGAAPRSPNAVPVPTASTALPSEPTVRDEVEKIRSSDHGAMPPAQRAMGTSTAYGRTIMTVRNSTAYDLSVFFDGSVAKKLTLAPGSSQDLDLAPGTFRVAGRVAAADVLPFYGEETYADSARYSVTFYIAP
jgi:tetratricopeptide (TPR) repeat protein